MTIKREKWEGDNQKHRRWIQIVKTDQKTQDNQKMATRKTTTVTEP